MPSAIVSVLVLYFEVLGIIAHCMYAVFLYGNAWCLYVVVLCASHVQDEDNLKVVETTVATFGALHISFINAGVITIASLTNSPTITEEQIDKTFGPNFKGVVFGIKNQVG